MTRRTVVAQYASVRPVIVAACERDFAAQLMDAFAQLPALGYFVLMRSAGNRLRPVIVAACQQTTDADRTTAQSQPSQFNF